MIGKKKNDQLCITNALQIIVMQLLLQMAMTPTG